jgi:hypothetical protein
MGSDNNDVGDALVHLIDAIHGHWARKSSSAGRMDVRGPDGDGRWATGDEVDDDGDGTMGDDNDDDGDNTTGDGVTGYDDDDDDDG